VHTQSVIRSGATMVLLGLTGSLFLGCGGSAGHTVGSEPIQSQNFGLISTRLVGTLQTPVVVSSNGLVVTGAAGATISGLLLSYPNPLLSQEQIMFFSNRGAGSSFNNVALYTMDSAGANVVKAPLFDAKIISFGGYSPDGTKVVYSALKPGVICICTANVDGTGELQLPTGINVADHPSWSPDGTEIAYDSNGSVFTILANGSGSPVNVISDGSSDSEPAWSPDGANIAYISGGQVDVKSSTPGGNSIIIHQGAHDTCPTWSPDGTQIAYSTDQDGAGTMHIYVSTYNQFPGEKQLTNTTGRDTLPAWSPDGSVIMVERLPGDGSSGNQTTLVSAVDGSTIANLTNNSLFVDNSPKWQPFQKARTLVGAGAPLGASAAGFLFGQQGNVVTSVLSFNASTPANARIVAQGPTSPDQPNLIFAITTADSLTALAFENNVNLPAVQLSISGNPSAAIVSFNALTGTVASVLPYAANRSAAAPPVQSGATLTYHAHFLGVFDAKGENLSPGGASEVRLDGRTGQIISYQ
jgi:hypothetical protein